jgi:hypothetical protein
MKVSRTEITEKDRNPIDEIIWVWPPGSVLTSDCPFAGALSAFLSFRLGLEFMASERDCQTGRDPWVFSVISVTSVVKLFRFLAAPPRDDPGLGGERFRSDILPSPASVVRNAD